MAYSFQNTQYQQQQTDQLCKTGQTDIYENSTSTLSSIYRENDVSNVEVGDLNKNNNDTHLSAQTTTSNQTFIKSSQDNDSQSTTQNLNSNTYSITQDNVQVLEKRRKCLRIQNKRIKKEKKDRRNKRKQKKKVFNYKNISRETINECRIEMEECVSYLYNQEKKTWTTNKLNYYKQKSQQLIESIGRNCKDKDKNQKDCKLDIEDLSKKFSNMRKSFTAFNQFLYGEDIQNKYDIKSIRINKKLQCDMKLKENQKIALRVFFQNHIMDTAIPFIFEKKRVVNADHYLFYTPQMVQITHGYYEFKKYNQTLTNSQPDLINQSIQAHSITIL